MRSVSVFIFFELLFIFLLTENEHMFIIRLEQMFVRCFILKERLHQMVRSYTDYI